MRGRSTQIQQVTSQTHLLIIHKENTKESDWKSSEKLLIFASLISPSEIILFEK